MVNPNEKRRLVEQLKNEFKKRDGGLMYSLEPMRWNSYFEKQAEQMLRSKSHLTTTSTPKSQFSESMASKTTRGLTADNYLARGQRYIEQGNYQQAIQEFESALKIDPERYYAWTRMAMAYKELGDVNSAIFCTRQALSIDPKNVAVWISLGSRYKEIGDYFHAIECYERVLEMYPDQVARICLNSALEEYPQYYEEKRKRERGS